MKSDKGITKTKRKSGSLLSEQSARNQTKKCMQAYAKQEKEYLEHFIRTQEKPIRSVKTAYIRPEFHERIQRIVSVIGKGQLSLSVFIDHVLECHFNDYEEVIRRLYNKNYEDIY